MINAILDAGVLISGLISSSGGPAQILDALCEGRFDVTVCPMLLAGVRRALGYPRLERYVSPSNADAFVAWIARVAVIHPDPTAIEPVTRDPNDDYLFALARGAHVDMIVSGDADLTDPDEAPIRILTPRAFLNLLDAQR
ncbi:MAG: putative toxin-antitoxin system toxin component, PIN family [Actinomycetota bacterium]